MRLTVSPQIFTDFDNPRIAVTVAKGINNHADISPFESELKALGAKLEEEYGTQVLSQLPKIAAQQELGELVQKHCGGNLEHFVLSKDNPEISF